LLTMVAIAILCFQAPVFSSEEVDENHEDKPGLDRIYFETYYRNLPTDRAKSKAKLEYNLIYNLRREILARDYSEENLKKVKEINPSNIRYERITRDSKWVRGMKKALPHLKEMEYMYIVKFEKYLCFINFHANPEDYILEPYQRELVFDGSDKYDIVIPPY